MPRSTLFPYTTLFRSWPSGQLLFVLGGFHAVFILAEWPETGHSVVAQTTVGVTENLGLRVREVKARRLTLCLGRTWLRLHRQHDLAKVLAPFEIALGRPGFRQGKGFADHDLKLLLLNQLENRVELP